jgi:hypothetical protein
MHPLQQNPVHPEQQQIPIGYAPARLSPGPDERPLVNGEVVMSGALVNEGAVVNGVAPVLWG